MVWNHIENLLFMMYKEYLERINFICMHIKTINIYNLEPMNL